MNNRYDVNDFEKVVNEEISVVELANKYGVSPNHIRQAMYNRGYHIHKRIVIVSPYKTMYVQDKQKCAEELGVSRQTIVNALKGKRIPMFEELGIKVMYDDGNV